MKVDLNHKFFDYISETDKAEIQAEIDAGITRIFVLTDPERNQLRAAFILTAYEDKIHIREVGGDYVWATKYANDYAGKVAEKMGIKKVSFTARNPIIQQRSKIYGFMPSARYNHEFERAV